MRNIQNGKLPLRLKLLVGICALVSACGTLDEAVPVSDQLTWVITKDEESGQAVRKRSITIAKGDSRNELIAKLGNSKDTHFFKKDSSIEVIRYTHTKIGPSVERMQSTKQGTMRVRAPLRYSEIVEVYLKQGVVAVVEVSKVELQQYAIERED